MPDWAAAVVGLHDFFERWFAGDVPNGAHEFRAFSDALDEDFSAVSPNGEEMNREATLAMVRDAHGSGGGRRISIDGCRVLHQQPPFALVRYVEIQDFEDGRHTERISTALLEAVPSAPDGVRWHTVQETWSPQPD